MISHAGHVSPTWDEDKSDDAQLRLSELALEREVSETIGAMPFLWLPIDDEAGPDSLRGLIERNAIALLSNFEKSPLDASSAGWLGLHCDRERVRKSGLWNSNHVDEPNDPAFLDELERAIATAAARP
jgi:hypothetical protein